MRKREAESAVAEAAEAAEAEAGAVAEKAVEAAEVADAVDVDVAQNEVEEEEEEVVAWATDSGGGRDGADGSERAGAGGGRDAAGTSQSPFGGAASARLVAAGSLLLMPGRNAASLERRRSASMAVMGAAGVAGRAERVARAPVAALTPAAAVLDASFSRSAMRTFRSSYRLSLVRCTAGRSSLVGFRPFHAAKSVCHALSSDLRRLLSASRACMRSERELRSRRVHSGSSRETDSDT